MAGILGEELRAGGHDVTVADFRDDPDPAGFDTFVLGSAVQAATWLPEGLAWLESHRSTVGRAALFNVSITAADPAKTETALSYSRAAAKLIDVVAEAAFAGRYQPENVGRWKRLLLAVLRKKPEDHVDPGAIRAWAQSLVIRGR